MKPEEFIEGRVNFISAYEGQIINPPFSEINARNFALAYMSANSLFRDQGLKGLSSILEVKPALYLNFGYGYYVKGNEQLFGRDYLRHLFVVGENHVIEAAQGSRLTLTSRR